MKILFWLLLLANLALLMGVQQKWFVQVDPVVQGAPLNVQMIRLQKEMKEAPAPASAPAPAPPDGQKAAAAKLRLETAMADTVSPPPAPAVCMEWGDFSGTDLNRANAILADLNLGSKLKQRQIEYNVGYWVYFPPQKNKAAVRKKVQEIRDLGINEYFVVTEGRWKNAITMGVFKTRGAAEHYLDQLHTQGVRTAIVDEKESKLTTTMFQLDGIGDSVVAKLEAVQKDFPSGELKSVDCTATAAVP